jgi:hypothetical protein
MELTIYFGTLREQAEQHAVASQRCREEKGQVGMTYFDIGRVVGFISGIGSWIYCIYEFGFLLGVGLGWIPALIVSNIAGIIWPIVVILAAWLFFK